MERLPDEILLRVFRNLKLVDLAENVGLTCKRFWTLAHDLSLWRDVTYGSAESVSLPFQVVLRACLEGVVNFTIDGRRSGGLTFLMEKMKGFTKLKRLCLRCTCVTLIDFTRLIFAYDSLEMIIIHDHFSSSDVHGMKQLMVQLRRIYNLPNVTFVRLPDVKLKPLLLPVGKPLLLYTNK